MKYTKNLTVGPNGLAISIYKGLIISMLGLLHYE
jgi:hypothetical protein